MTSAAPSLVLFFVHSVTLHAAVEIRFIVGDVLTIDINFQFLAFTDWLAVSLLIHSDVVGYLKVLIN